MTETADTKPMTGLLAGLPALKRGDFWLSSAQLATVAGVPVQLITSYVSRRSTARNPAPAAYVLPGISARFHRASEALVWLAARGIPEPDWSLLSEAVSAEEYASQQERARATTAAKHGSNRAEK
jgi:hypothetical protein